MADSEPRTVASPTSTEPGRRDRLEPRSGVDEVAGDHALAVGRERDRRLARDHRASRRDARSVGRSQPADRVEQVHGRANRAFGIVLVRDRRAPHGHDRIADELLDGPAVAVDALPREHEVAVQELAHGLGIAVVGECREAHQVREQDAHDAPFGGAADSSHRVDRCGRGHARG